jgi:hypothetical protein
MQRLEKAKETETAELRSKLESAQGDVRVQLKSKDDKISEVIWSYSETLWMAAAYVPAGCRRLMAFVLLSIQKCCVQAWVSGATQCLGTPASFDHPSC